MANFCSNCGQAVTSSDTYCPSCGAQLNGGVSNTANYSNANSGVATGANTVSGILGTLVTVSLIGGLTRQLYYYGGRYFLDPYCHRPYGSPHLICGRPPMGGPMGGPRGGHMGGPMGGGPRGGGPRGGGPMGGPRGGGHR
jgi:hypothetical protein